MPAHTEARTQVFWAVVLWLWLCSAYTSSVQSAAAVLRSRSAVPRCLVHGGVNLLSSSSRFALLVR